MAIHATIDWDKCEGNGVCARVAGEVFSCDAEGNSDVLLEAIPEELRAKVRLAVLQCPTNAIAMTED